VSIATAADAADSAAAAPLGVAHDDARRTDTRQRILHTAARLFGERGYAATSIQAIADELGVTKAALYYHFASKHEILHELVDQPIAAIRDVLDQSHELHTAEGRRALAVTVIGALSQCDAEVVAIFKDPGLAPAVGMEVQHSGITHRLATMLAMGKSGVDRVEDTKPEHMVRAIAAVGGVLAAIDSWHVVYPDCEHFSPEHQELMVSMVTSTLEGDD